MQERELTRAEETIRREQQQIQEMRQRVSPVCGVVCVVTRGPPEIMYRIQDAGRARGLPREAKSP